MYSSVLIVGVSPESLSQPMCLAIAAHKPALLILASRSQTKINKVIDEIRSSASNVAVSSVVVDLSSFPSIRSAAAEIKNLTSKLDIIINNAAVNPLTRQLAGSGIELHFGTNHLGPFLLTNLLLPLLEQAAKSSSAPGSTRIVNLTSQGHRISPIRFSDINFEKIFRDLPVEERPPTGLPPAFFDPEKAFSPFVAYGQSKTSNILFSVYLTKHLKEKGIMSYAVHPGCKSPLVLFDGLELMKQAIWTGLARSLDEDARNIIKKMGNRWKNAQQGAAPALIAAFDPALNGEFDDGCLSSGTDVVDWNTENGVYLVECQFGKAADFAMDPEAAESLWRLSERLVGLMGGG
jgi:NAD(P)-dependent dehydrogenase (short-subunit alcohol dehydrogenase family)